MRKLALILVFGTIGFQVLAQLSARDRYIHNRDLENVYNKQGLHHASIYPRWEDAIHDSLRYYSFFNRSVQRTKTRNGERRKLTFLFLPDMIIGGSSDRFVYEQNFAAGLKYERGSTWNAHLIFRQGWNQYAKYLHAPTVDQYVDPIGGLVGPEFGPQSNYLYANVTYAPGSRFKFSLGNEKPFLGDGYRSLLISDHMTPYLNLKMQAKIWKFHYFFMIAQMRGVFNWPRNGINLSYWNLQEKFAAIHYMSWKITKRLNLSLFESTIWRDEDDKLIRGVDVNYLNPVIFWRPVEFSTGSSDNSFVGLNGSLLLSDQLSLYGQFILDEFLLSELRARNGWWANKYGIQFGARWLKPFGVKGLSAQGEFNYVRPFTYLHVDELQNYGHANMEIAHPYGANFIEGLFRVQYAVKNLDFTFHLSYAQQGIDSLFGDQTHPITGLTYTYGGDVFTSYQRRNGTYGHDMLQGLKTDIVFGQLTASYMIAPKHRLRAELNTGYRSFVNGQQSDGEFFMTIGLRTYLSTFDRSW